MLYSTTRLGAQTKKTPMMNVEKITEVRSLCPSPPHYIYQNNDIKNNFNVEGKGTTMT